MWNSIVSVPDHCLFIYLFQIETSRFWNNYWLFLISRTCAKLKHSKKDYSILTLKREFLQRFAAFSVFITCVLALCQQWASTLNDSLRRRHKQMGWTVQSPKSCLVNTIPQNL